MTRTDSIVGFLQTFKGGLLASDIDDDIKQLGLDVLDADRDGKGKITITIQVEGSPRGGAKLTASHKLTRAHKTPLVADMFCAADGILSTEDPRQMNAFEADDSIHVINGDRND